MSKRSERREAERLARRQAYLATKSSEAIPETTPEPAAAPAPAPEPQISEAQLAANRANAQHSTGPRSEAAKQIVSQNRRTHGLTGRFLLLEEEDPTDYARLADETYDEYKPQTATERRLVESLIQHYWLNLRAQRFQTIACAEDEDKKFALYLRYQTLHERAYYKAQKELQTIRKERAKEQNGFESQKRAQEAHEAKIRLAHAKAGQLEVDSACRQVMEAPLPGKTKLSFAQLTAACSEAIALEITKMELQKQSASA